MKENLDAMEQTSRRNFAKAIMAALVATPLLSSLVNARDRRAQRRQPRGTGSKGTRQTVPEGPVHAENQHDLPPPIELVQGSLLVEIDKDDFDAIPTGGGRRKHHRKASGTGMNKVELAHIKVIDGSGESLYRNLFAEGCTVTFGMGDGSQVMVAGGIDVGSGQTALEINTPDTHQLAKGTGGDVPIGSKRRARFRYKRGSTQPSITSITVSKSGTLYQVSPSADDEVMTRCGL